MRPSRTPATPSETPDPGSSQGIPDKTPAAGRARPGKAETPADASDEARLAMPHERDQSADTTGAQTDPQVRQAGADLQRGLRDTDKGPAMEAAYNKLKGR